MRSFRRSRSGSDKESSPTKQAQQVQEKKLAKAFARWTAAFGKRKPSK
jgi:hypothetical protein